MSEENTNGESPPQIEGGASRHPAIRGPFRPGMMQPGGGAPLSAEEERIWDKKEDESRAKIKERYDGVIEELQDSKDKILSIVNNAPIVFKGRDNRIDVTREEVEDVFDSIRKLNSSLGKTKSLFDAYVHFARSTPDLKNINNIIYNFNKFLMDSQKRPFAILWSQEDKFYFRAVRTKEYANSLSFLIERIIGALSVAGNYVTDIPKVHHNTQQRYDGMGSPQLGGMNRFTPGVTGSRFPQSGLNNNSYLNKLYEQSMGTGSKRNMKSDPLLEEIRRMKTVEKSVQRDFGDENEEYGDF